MLQPDLGGCTEKQHRHRFARGHEKKPLEQAWLWEKVNLGPLPLMVDFINTEVCKIQILQAQGNSLKQPVQETLARGKQRFSGLHKRFLSARCISVVLWPQL